MIVSLDTCHTGNVRRVQPKYTQLLPRAMRTRFKLGARIEHDGKVYAAELHHCFDHSIEVTIWLSGRAMPESAHKAMRLAVAAAYGEVYAVSPATHIESGNVYWRRDPRLIMTGETL